jgi:hypothetical protein
MRLPDPWRLILYRKFTDLEDGRGAHAAVWAILQRAAAALLQPRVPITVLQSKDARAQRGSKPSADLLIGSAPD